jgi:hypothetical protein
MCESDETTERQDFINYIWSYYGPGEVYGYLFNHKLTYEEVVTATKKQIEEAQVYVGDLDEELVRDMMLADSPLGAEDLTAECSRCASITSRLYIHNSALSECPKCAMERIAAGGVIESPRDLPF